MPKKPERISFEQFQVKFEGDHKPHEITYRDGSWNCDCNFFEIRGVCSHVMTLERILIGTVKPAEAVPAPA